MQAPAPSPSQLNQMNVRMIAKILQSMIKYEENEEKKANCSKVLEKFVQFRNTAMIKQLDKESQTRLVEMRTMLQLYRKSFETTTQKTEFEQFRIPGGQIADVLINLQQKIDPRDFKTSYLRGITIKKKEFNWSKQFIQEWIKGIEEERILSDQANRQKQLDRNKQSKGQPASQPVPSTAHQNLTQPPPTETQQLKAEEKKTAPPRPAQKSTQKIPGQKPQKKVKKDETGEKPEKEKKPPKPKKQADDSESSDNQTAKQTTRKKQQKEARDRLERYEKPKQPKNRVKALMQYLSGRKDFPSLGSNPHKLKQIAQFLNQNLQKFMKHHLTNLIEIAKLRNRRHQTLASSGNEFTYFSKEGYTSVKPINHLQVSQQPAKMLKLNYKSKFELYSLLRSREQLLEESLLKMYASKKDAQNNKTSDKKLWEYLLRPNHVTERTEQFIEMEQNRTDRLSIEISHIRYLFQAHKFIRNTWLMMNCYNS